MNRGGNKKKKKIKIHLDVQEKGKTCNRIGYPC